MNFKKQLIIAMAFVSVSAFAQTPTPQTFTNKKDGNYKFTVVKNLDATAVQDQAHSGTCWTFSSLSFIESELLRMGKPKVNLSEMFIVHNAYNMKADKYVRMHGSVNFGEGGAFHDVMAVVKDSGIVPQMVYSGFANGEKDVNGEKKINHSELDALTKNIVETVVKSDKPGIAWKKAFNGTLDAYLGPIPKTFTYEGKQYTPQTFRDMLGINPNNYIEISSFNHHPFYSKFVLEVPDNWAADQVYNLPLDEMIAVMDNALMNGYTIAWGADVSEKGFSFKNGVAIVPDLEWGDVKKEKMDSVILNPGKQKVITQEMRQEAFNNYETQDDHGMHIVGIVKDQNGVKYYIVKNSWGVKGNDCDGFFYASEAYVKYKTTSIMLNKDGVSKDIAKKLGL
ncbi:MAG: aminopeptidase [Bacteroidetes bacterium]|nr:aminopeptidase [Bacteroidota bacterium]